MIRCAGAVGHRIVAALDYLAEHGTPVVPEDLLEHAWLHHKYPSTGRLERWSLMRDGVDLDLAPLVTCVAGTLEPQIHFAEEGFGLACLPRFAVRGPLRRSTLVSVLQAYLRDVGVFYILWPVGRHPSPKVSAFAGFMANNFLRKPQDLPGRRAAD